MKTILKIVIALIIFTVLCVGGCAALVGSAADQVQKDSDEHSITVDQFKSVKVGSSKADVIKSLGEPSDKQHMKTKGMSSDCIYYNIKGDVLSSYQFCFTNGSLDTKSKY